MKLQKFEQSGFICQAENGFRIAWDIGRMTPIESLDAVRPVDVMIISHIHGDHFSVDHIKKLQPKRVFLNKECVDALGEEAISFEIVQVAAGTVIEEKDFAIEFFAVDHGPNISAPIENLGFIVKVENQRIYFAGDMFYESGVDISQYEVDYALIPVGTYYTFGPKEAYEFAKKFKHIETLIPIHYFKTPETCIEFLKLAQVDFHVEMLKDN